MIFSNKYYVIGMSIERYLPLLAPASLRFAGSFARLVFRMMPDCRVQGQAVELDHRSPSLRVSYSCLRYLRTR